MNGRELFITDLDGTLLDSDSRVPAESARILRSLSEDGAMIGVATARTPATVVPLLHDCGLRLPVIVFTGAAMWDMAHNRYVSMELLAADSVRMVSEACMRHGVGALRYTIAPDGVMIHAYYNGPGGAAPSAKEQQFIDERRGLALKRFHINVPDGLTCAQDRTIMVFGIGATEAVKRVAAELTATGCYSVSCYPDIFDSSTSMIEVFAPGVSKAAAVKRLAAMTGAERVTVFGDNLNDLPMMEVADTAVAVSNAMEAVRLRADVVIGPNTDNAVARYIQNRVRSMSVE
ncbi:MAG: HAD family hydrolase [Muribaculaceae bacterium]|nr:HAD family hydrolase [Muribaculaceae bacterium]